MGFEAGSILGTFEITGQIGAGGMGEVYRARDTKLGRDVAIKTLPESLATDADRLARFEREAKLLASLNHANIASVYNLDEQDGTLYIAMELVEGETLEARLRNGALPVDETLALALQIAQALEAAHAKGVIHRDLKPANVMITPDGVVKVLDFGLAKAFSGDPSEASPAHSPALSAAMTQQGLILGTAGYMSPEQASGQATDQHADVWSFGVVVYEMLTGMPVFEGESVPHILAAVLQLEPEWSRLPPNLHPRIRFMLERCLTKKPRNRYSGIADARADIDAVIRDPAGAWPDSAGAVSTPAGWSMPRVAMAVGVLIAVAALSAGAVWLGARTEAEPPHVTRFTVEPPVNEASLLQTRGRLIALSPDGRRLSINSSEGIFIRELDSLEARLIPGSEEANATGPFFTPDGLALNFGGGQGVRRISIDGGPIVAAGRGAIAGDQSCGIAGPPDFFIDDNTRLVFCLSPPRGLYTMRDDGTQELLLDWREDTIFLYPSLLPGGEYALVSVLTIAQAVSSDGGDIRAVSLDSGESRVLIEGARWARYFPTGHIVFVRGDVLYGVSFDLDSLTVTSAEAPLVADIHLSLNNEPSFSISRNGTLAYALEPSSFVASDLVSTLLGSTRIERIAADGSVTVIEADGRFSISPRFNPDGRRLSVLSVGIDESDGRPVNSLSIGAYDLERGGARIPLASGPTGAPSYLWTPDGESIIYGGPDGILGRRADGSGTATTLWTMPSDLGIQTAGLRAMTNDQSVVLIDGAETGSEQSRIYRLALQPDSRPELLIESAANLHSAALSPDNRWLAYASDESGADQVFVVPYPEVDAYRVPVSTNGGTEPIWDPSENRLWFRDGDDLLAVDYQTEPRFSAAVPVTVIAGAFPPFGDVALHPVLLGPTYAVAPDGAGFAHARLDDSAGPDEAGLEIVVVENWFEELEARLPSR